MEARARSAIWRWGLAGLAGLFGLVALALLLLHALDQPWLKPSIQRALKRAAGIELDYRALDLSLSTGITIEDLTLRSPPAAAGVAPQLAHIGRVSVRWSLPSRLERVTIDDAALWIVRDARGRTSFDMLFPERTPARPKPARPLSQLPAAVLEPLSQLPAFALQGAELTFIQLAQDGHEQERMSLHGLALSLSDSRNRASAQLGTHEKPLELSVSRAADGGEARARAQLAAALELTPERLHTKLELRMLEQSFATSIYAQHALQAEASARFDARAAQTEVQLEQLQAGDGALQAQAVMTLPDAGDPLVREARLELDLARLLTWLPPGLVPLTAARAQAHAKVQALILGSVVRMANDGFVDLDAELAQLALDPALAEVAVGTGRLSLHAKPAPGERIATRGTLALDDVHAHFGAHALAARALTLDADGQQTKDGLLDGSAHVHFASASEHGAWEANAGRLQLQANGVYLDAQEPLRSRGTAAVSGELAACDLTAPHVSAQHVTFSVHSSLQGAAPYAGRVELATDRLTWKDETGHALVDDAARVKLDARDVQPPLNDPRTSVHSEVELGVIHVALDATKSERAIDYKLGTQAPSLGALRPLLSAAVGVPWERMALALHSQGHLTGWDGPNPSLRHDTRIELQRPSWQDVGARALQLLVSSQGTRDAQQGELDLRVQALARGDHAPSDDHVTLSGSFDRRRPALQALLRTEGLARSELALTLNLDGKQHSLKYDARAHVAQLEPLARELPALGGLKLEPLGVDLTAQGTLSGMFTDASLHVAPEPLRTAHLEGTASVHATHVRWARADSAFATPELHWELATQGSPQRRTATSRLELGTAHLAFGDRELDANGVQLTTNAVLTGDLREPELEFRQHLTVHAVEQAFLPEVPLGQLELEIAAERATDGVLHISELKATNAASGTELALTGNVDIGEDRRTLSITGSLAQDLTSLSSAPERMRGQGKLAVEATLTSPDFERFHVRAAVSGEDVSLRLPRAGIDLERASGEVPVALSFVLGPQGVIFERSDRRNPYSMLRFADQHPLLTRSGFLSIAKLDLPMVSIAPLVGNLEVEQNVISLRQFEMGVRGGRITGQCGVDLDGERSTLELHVRANGVRSSHGEPFDGNIAVAISAANHSIDGRAEILRIGERHLLDLLDLQDPTHLDPAMNRVRSALSWGYPKSLRLVFDHGFASAHLELGGLAKLISISELRGIPMGPVVDNMLARMRNGSDLKEEP